MSNKMWRCKFCGNVQSVKLDQCTNCGANLTMGGAEYVNEHSPASAQKKSPWLLIVLAAVVLILVVAVLLLMGNDPTPEPVNTAPTAAPTAQPTQAVPEDIPTAPDFLAFADAYAQKHMIDRNAIYTNYQYRLDVRDAAEFIVQEYLALVENNYSFVLADMYTRQEDNWDMYYYGYCYTGSAAVSEFTVTGSDGGDSQPYHFLVRLAVKEETVYIFVAAANEIQLEDPGVRVLEPTAAATEPSGATVVGVTLNCYDMLLNYQSLEPTNWVPVDYMIGYDVSIGYTGTKTKEFDIKVTSSDENVLRVAANGYGIHAVGPGTATITAEVDGITDSREITVFPVDRSTGSTLTFNTDTVHVSGSDPVEVTLTLTAAYGEGVTNSGYNGMVGKGIHFVSDSGWNTISDGVTSQDMTFTIDPQTFYTSGATGFLFYLTIPVEDGSFHPVDYATVTVTMD